MITTTRTFLDVYRVKADRETGEWLSCERGVWPRARVAADAWALRADTDEVAYSTAEIDGQTVAVQIEWVS